jgi:hypothetical protein
MTTARSSVYREDVESEARRVGAPQALTRVSRLVRGKKKILSLKNRRASVGAGPNSVAETFSLGGSLSSPQQPIAINQHSTKNIELVNARKLAVGDFLALGAFPRRFKAPQ